jgi:hypothetical protein
VEPRSIEDPAGSGLSTGEAEARLAREGPNEVAAHTPASVLRQLLASVSNPLLGILLVAAAASAVLGERVNALIVVAMVVLSAGIDFVQSFRSAKAVDRLRAKVAPTATVLRDGRWTELPRRELVPGDVVRLSAGDLSRPTRGSSPRGPCTSSSRRHRRVLARGEGGRRRDPGQRSIGRSRLRRDLGGQRHAEAVVEHTGGRTQLGSSPRGLPSARPRPRSSTASATSGCSSLALSCSWCSSSGW